MATLTGITITTALGGKLTGSGGAIIWCGSCGCTGGTATKSFDLGNVPPGTYAINFIDVGGCNVKSSDGAWGVFAAFNGQRFKNPADNGEWVYQQSSCKLTLVESDPIVPHDCLNGGCVPKTTYNTPGKYANLAACQAGCAKDSPCTGECVSAAELAALQQAAGALQSRICGG